MASTVPILWPDDLHFDSFGGTEEMMRYIPGGYHPIIIGDIIAPSPGKNDSSQYRIMHKLGYGSYSTVWLAQKLEKNGTQTKWVAVKVTIAGKDDCKTREAAMLKTIPTCPFQDSHVLTLLDHFTLHGPNGSHSVIVTNVVAPLLQLLNYERSPLWRKAAVRGLVQGMVQLHAAGIVHGDLHLGNVGAAFPELDDQDPHHIMMKLDLYDMTVVLPISATHQTPALPAYVTGPTDLGGYYNDITSSGFPHTVILDFGGAHATGTLPLHFQCSMECIAPEVVFAKFIQKVDNPPVEPSADIWGLGTAIFEIVSGLSLFDGANMYELPTKMVSMAGSLPPEWLDWHSALSDPVEVSASAAAEWWASEREALRRNCVNDADTDTLIALLRRILVLEPSLRPTAAEILEDPWFSM